MFYLDSSFLVAALTQEEVFSKATRQWLRHNRTADLAISPWVETEVASASSIKIRTGALSVEQRASFLNAWRHFREDSTVTVEIKSIDFAAAAGFATRYDLSLRGGDALHLAIAHRIGATLVTLDQGMAAAALELAVPVATL